MGYPRIPHKFIDSVEHKRCGRCKEYKVIKMFSKQKRSWDGLQDCCKSCKKVQRTTYMKKYPNKLKAKGKKYREENRERIRGYHKKWREENPERLNTIRKKVREKRVLNGKEAEYKRKRYKSDINYRLRSILRCRLAKSLRAKGVKKTVATMKLCGCSLEKLKQHLESQFTDGMSWENKGKWHIDHIRPVSSFDLADVEQQKECFHFTNLQPLWALDNIKKGAKY